MYQSEIPESDTMKPSEANEVPRTRRGLLKAMLATPAIAAVPAVAHAETEEQALGALRELLWNEIPPNMPLTQLDDVLRAQRAAILAIIDLLEK